MSDTNYMNAYVNLVMETVHTNLNDILQLKTQTKLLNDLVLEKDQVISSLTSQLEEAKVNNSKNEIVEVELQKLRDNAASWEFQYNSMKEKVSHMDTLANQYNDLQKQFVQQSSEFERTTVAFTELKQKAQDYEQTIKKLTTDLASTTKKIDRLAKKEVKTIVANVPSKNDINREETKSTPVAQPQKPKAVVVEKPKRQTTTSNG